MPEGWLPARGSGNSVTTVFVAAGTGAVNPARARKHKIQRRRSAAEPQPKRIARRPRAPRLRLKAQVANLPSPPPFAAAATGGRSRSGKILAELHDSDVLHCRRSQGIGWAGMVAGGRAVVAPAVADGRPVVSGTRRP